MRLLRQEQCRFQCAFSLVELMIALVLSSLLAMGAYKGFMAFTSTSMGVAQEGERKFEREKLGEAMRLMVENVALIRAEQKDETFASKLANLNPSGDPVPGPIIPFPGYSKEDLTARNQNLRLIPKAANESGSFWRDAIRFVYYPKDSESAFLAVDSDGTFPSEQVTEPDRPITLTSRGGLQVGDYAVISDNVSSDLFRITDIQEEGAVVHIYHSDISIWNQPFLRNYGHGFDGGDAYVQKVKLATLAYSANDAKLYRDDHVYDDGFDPGTRTFSGNPDMSTGYLASQWHPLMDNLFNFKISYVVTSGEEGEVSETRTPTANYPGKNDNQLGDPNLTSIRFDFTFCHPEVQNCAAASLNGDTAINEAGERFSAQISPENLRRRRGQTWEGATRNRGEFYHQFVRVVDEDDDEDDPTEDDDDDDSSDSGGTSDFGPPGGGSGTGN